MIIIYLKEIFFDPYHPTLKFTTALRVDKIMLKSNLTGKKYTK